MCLLRLGLDRHLFLMNLKNMDLNGLTSFYASALQVWHIFSVERVNVWTRLLSTELLNSVTLRNNLINVGICKIGHLKMNHQWITAEELHLKTDVRSLRVKIAGRNKEPIVSSAITSGEL